MLDGMPHKWVKPSRVVYTSKAITHPSGYQPGLSGYGERYCYGSAVNPFSGKKCGFFISISGNTLHVEAAPWMFSAIKECIHRSEYFYDGFYRLQETVNEKAFELFRL